MDPSLKVSGFRLVLQDGVLSIFRGSGVNVVGTSGEWIQVGQCDVAVPRSEVFV